MRAGCRARVWPPPSSSGPRSPTGLAQSAASRHGPPGGLRGSLRTPASVLAPLAVAPSPASLRFLSALSSSPSFPLTFPLSGSLSSFSPRFSALLPMDFLRLDLTAWIWGAWVWTGQPRVSRRWLTVQTGKPEAGGVHNPKADSAMASGWHREFPSSAFP